MQHELYHIYFNATPNSSSSQFGMAVVETISAGILLPSTGMDVATNYKRLSGLTRQAFCLSDHRAVSGLVAWGRYFSRHSAKAPLFAALSFDREEMRLVSLRDG